MKDRATIQGRRIGAGVCLAFLLLAGVLRAAPGGPRALIVYDGKLDSPGEGYLGARYIANLLGHFSVQQGDLKPLEQYRKGDTQRYDLTFFMSVVSHPKYPAGFLDDATSGQKTFVWLGRNISDALTREGEQKLGFSYIDYLDDEEFDSVVYRNIQLPKGDPELSLVAVVDNAKVRVHAAAKSPSRGLYPYVLQSGNFWYFADSPFSFTNEGDRYLVFCDLLHDILKQPHPASRRAMVRIEDVSTDDDPEDLRAIADYFYAQGIPFQIALIPIFKDPERGLEVWLSDRRAFVDALHYMVSRGGSVLLHGVTHQYRGVSGDDYEFWNELADKPIPNDGQRDALERKLELAFRECFRNGIYPIAWETPHNAGSARTYTFLKDYFSVFHERELAGPTLASEQLFPYPLRDVYGRFVVSENLGYLPEDKTDPAPIVDHARSMLAVRDGIAIFYFHPFMKLDYLKQMVSGVRGLGYQFISLREFAPRVNFREWQVAVADRNGQVPPPAAKSSRYLHRIVIAPDGAVSENTLAASEAARPVANLSPGSVVAFEPASGPAAQGPSWLARARLWLWGSPQRSTSTPVARRQGLPAVALLWNPVAQGPAALEQQSFESIFNTYGYPVERVIFQVRRAQPFAPVDRLLVIPAFLAPQLSPQQQTMVQAHLRAGGRLLLAGRSTLAERLGLEFSGRTITVTQATDLEFPEQYLHWKPGEKVERFEPPDEHVPLMIDAESRQVLAFRADFDRGKYVYLATPLDSVTGLGIARYAYLANHLQEAFATRARLTRPRLEAYFDPGYRQGLDPGRLINSWRKTGIRTVYVAAWHKYPRYQFPYQTFIDLCHRNGIAAYAWFELPMVTKWMWDDHPEWREKSATGDDARAGWRYPINMRNPQALAASLEYVREVMAFDWDGVDIAELNYDAGDPVMDAKTYVPMNEDVRKEFRGLHGFDPVELFNPQSHYYWQTNHAALKSFTDYRVRLVTDLHRTVLDELMRLRQKRDLEIIVTVLDSLHSKTLRSAIGVDSREIVRLMDRYPFTLQVEDPSEFWASTPERYREFGRTYLGLVKDPSRLMFDVNVVPDRDVSNSRLPLGLATGAEFARLLAAASAPTGRAAVYSESTVSSQDWEMAAGVAASPARIQREGEGSWRIDAPFTVAVRTSTERTNVYLDGRPWPALEAGSVLIPPGRHLLSFSRPFASFLDFEQLDLRLRSLSAELLSADATSRGMIFDYQSRGRSFAVFNKQPYRVRVDGRDWTAPPLYSHGEWAISLPSGRHTVVIVANEPAVFAVEATSLLFSSFIVFFGVASCGSMLVLYLLIRLRRTARALRRRFYDPVPEISS